MQTIIQPSLLGSVAAYTDKLHYRGFAAWLLATLVVLAGFKYARGAVSALLMKLYELFIQKNILKL